MKSSARGRLAGMACASGMVLLVTACGGADGGSGDGGGSGSGADSAGGKKRAAPAGVVTTARAGEIVDHYEKFNNQANKESDPKVLSKVEGGAVFEQSKSTYKMQRNWSKKERADYREPFHYVDRRFHIPKKGAADWFMMTAHSKNAGEKKGKYPGILVFERQSGGAWKMVASSYSETKWMPELAEDKDGFAVPLPDTAKKTGPMAPDGLSDALLELYEGTPSATTRVAESGTTKWIRKVPKEQNRLLSPHGEAEFSRGEPTHEKIHALKTKDGGSLSVFSTHVREHDRGTSAIASVNPSDSMEVYLDSGSSMPSFFVDWLHQTSAYIPPKSSAKVRLLGSEYDMTDAKPGAGTDGEMPGTDT
ncbi:hypothetical protein GCM10009801_59910 [Streptomyces albiaxialis]|uniref:DUF8094 domain-containing protein n=1 Tax=Streptomyces albiaxialis TaxID=329523 RepID=A0ABN2WKP7_9ACTN